MGNAHTDDVALDVIPAGQPVTLPGPRLGLPTMAELETLKSYGELVIASGMAPKHIERWETAVVIMRYGHQLGIDEFTALQNMFVVNGKPAMMASLMHAMILRDHGPDAVQIMNSTAQVCQLLCTRRGSRVSTTVEYSIEEAQKAGLKSAVWLSYPKDMLFARAISRAGREIFRDTTMGLYCPEEVGGAVIDVRGEVIDVDEQVRTAHIRELRDENDAEKQLPDIRSGPLMATKSQIEAIAGLGTEIGMTLPEVKKRVGKPSKELTSLEADLIIQAFRSIKSDIAEKERQADSLEQEVDQPELASVAAGNAGNDRYTS